MNQRSLNFYSLSNKNRSKKSTLPNDEIEQPNRTKCASTPKEAKERTRTSKMAPDAE
jgi:hypothetical protein